MAKEQRQLSPRRMRMRRAGRIQAASQCLERFSGGRPVRSYARWFGVDLECAVTELQLLGVALDAGYLQALRASVEGQRRAKAAAAERADADDGRSPDAAFPHGPGDRGVEWDWFYPDDDHWDGSPFGDFHLIFAPDVVERFEPGDLAWFEEAF